MHIANLDLNLLRVLDALLQERSVTRAGARLGLTQSAVSHALNRLRHALDDALFVRGAGGLRPTARAVEIAPALHAALEQLQSVLSPGAFDPALSTRRFGLMAGAYACAVLVPKLVERMRALAPATELRVEGYGGELAETLDAGAVDFAIGDFDSAAERFAIDTLFQEELVWVVRPGHPLTEGDLSLERLSACPNVMVDDVRARFMAAGVRGGAPSRLGAKGRAALEAELVRQGLSIPVGVVVPDTFSALAVVARSDMTALVARRLADEAARAGGVTVLEPPYHSPSVGVRLLYRRDRLRDPAVAWLRALLLEITADGV